MSDVDNKVTDLQHWAAWRLAVEQTGYTRALKWASSALQILDTLSPEEVEILFKQEIQHLKKKG